jgi:hypothetical protein
MDSIRTFFRMVVLVGFILLIVSCTQTPPAGTSATPTENSAALTEFARPQPTYPPLPTPTITPTPLGGASATLGPVPQDCPPGPAPQNFNSNSNFESAVGGGSVWVSGFSGPHALLEWLPNLAVETHYQYGWGHKMLWAVKNSVKGPVTIRGANLTNGLPLRPVADAASPDSTPTVLVLNPSDPNAQFIDQWVEFPGGLDIPQAGCYYLEASWPGGSWRITFAAGEVQ